MKGPLKIINQMCNKMAQTEMDFISGEELRDAGINQAIKHANEKEENWSEIAYKFLLKYLETANEFMVEDVPPSLRAWGGIIVRASKSKLIYRIGFKNVVNAKAHCTPASIWKKL